MTEGKQHGSKRSKDGQSKVLLSAACMVNDALSSRRPEISVLVIQTPLRAMPQRRRRDTAPPEHCFRDVLEITLNGTNFDSKSIIAVTL